MQSGSESAHIAWGWSLSENFMKVSISSYFLDAALGSVAHRQALETLVPV